MWGLGAAFCLIKVMNEGQELADELEDAEGRPLLPLWLDCHKCGRHFENAFEAWDHYQARQSAHQAIEEEPCPK